MPVPALTVQQPDQCISCIKYWLCICVLCIRSGIVYFCTGWNEHEPHSEHIDICDHRVIVYSLFIYDVVCISREISSIRAHIAHTHRRPHTDTHGTEWGYRQTSARKQKQLYCASCPPPPSQFRSPAPCSLNVIGNLIQSVFFLLSRSVSLRSCVF